jgi:starvation-inducible DNA-binding protein
MNYLNIQNENILPVAKELNQLLADYHLYYQKLRNFHWNITGENFFILHEKFEELYKDAHRKIDEIAERILTLQYHPMSRYSSFLKASSISESFPLLSDDKMVKSIIHDHKILLKQMSKIIKEAETAMDEGTIDLISGYIVSMEKTSWMLNAFIKKRSEKLNEELVSS